MFISFGMFLAQSRNQSANLSAALRSLHSATNVIGHELSRDWVSHVTTPQRQQQINFGVWHFDICFMTWQYWQRAPRRAAATATIKSGAIRPRLYRFHCWHFLMNPRAHLQDCAIVVVSNHDSDLGHKVWWQTGELILSQVTETTQLRKYFRHFLSWKVWCPL